jgi:hypothetical protein
LGNIWRKVGDIWRKLGDIWRKLGDIWRKLGDIWGKLENIWRKLGDIWRKLGDIWTKLGDIWRKLGISAAIFGNAALEVSQNRFWVTSSLSAGMKTSLLKTTFLASGGNFDATFATPLMVF